MANHGFNDDEDVLEHLVPMSNMGIAGLDAAIKQMNEKASIQITKTIEGPVTRYTIKEDTEEVGEIILTPQRVIYIIRLWIVEKTIGCILKW